MMSVKKFFKTNLKRVLKSPAILRCLGFLVFAYTKFVGETSHWKFEGLDETLDKVKAPIKEAYDSFSKYNSIERKSLKNLKKLHYLIYGNDINQPL